MSQNLKTSSIMAATLFMLFSAPLAGQALAHQLNTDLTIQFDNETPAEGDIVTITGTVTTSDTGAHQAVDPVETGSGRIEQGVDSGDNPVSDCSLVDHYLQLSNDTPQNGEFSYDLDTAGLGGQTLVFRAHYVTPGGGHAPATTNTECLSLSITEDPFDGSKTWTHTDYNWDPICIETAIDEDESSPTFGEEICVEYRAANINYNGEDSLPDDDVLADSLDLPVLDGISDVSVQVKNNGEISNMNPGAVYALTTIEIKTDLAMIEIIEDYSECTDLELELLNQNKLSRNIKVAVADQDGFVTEVTDRLYDELDDGIIFTEPVSNSITKVKFNDLGLLNDGNTIFLLVKFDDKLRGEDSSLLPLECVNHSTASTDDPEFEKAFDAILRFTQAP